MTTRYREFHILSKLAIPIILGNVGSMTLHVVDTIMVGQLSTEALASAAIGGLWTSGTILLAMGAVMGIDPVISQAHGAGDEERSSLAVQRGLLIALASSVVVALLWAFAGKFLLLLQQDPELVVAAEDYVGAQIFSIPFFMCFIVLREYLQCREIMKPVMYVTIGANVFNWAANEVFIFGFGSFEGWGLYGAGVATGLSRVFMLFALLLFVRRGRLFEGAWTGWSRKAWSGSGMEEVLRHGFATMMHLALEIWAFGTATAMAGKLAYDAADASILASHQIVMNIASLTFMVPMGVSFAVTTRVGNLVGRREYGRAQHAASVAMKMGAGSMAICGALLFFARFQIPVLYDMHGDTLTLAAAILPIAATFQVFDGLQVVGSGILRGMGRTHISAVVSLFGYWVLAIPLAWLLAFHLDYGLSGIWWGLCLGLFVVAVTLVFWIRRQGPASLDSSTT